MDRMFSVPLQLHGISALSIFIYNKFLMHMFMYSFLEVYSAYACIYNADMCMSNDLEEKTYNNVHDCVAGC